MNGNFLRAKSLSKVINLNEDAAVNIESYSGFITIKQKLNTFFWFFTAEAFPEEKPLIIWLQVSISL